MHDKKNGEWFWGVNADYSVMDQEDKVGIWKCPYHNSRACIEIMQRIDALDENIIPIEKLPGQTDFYQQANPSIKK